jgi:hypothetical protein
MMEATKEAAAPFEWKDLSIMLGFNMGLLYPEK